VFSVYERGGYSVLRHIQQFRRYLDTMCEDVDVFIHYDRSWRSNGTMTPSRPLLEYARFSLPHFVLDGLLRSVGCFTVI
jgi:hypothetical protein